MAEDALIIELDPRARLFTAVLAASDWPEREQAQSPHAVHGQAKKVRQWVRPWQDHPTVQAVNAALADGHSPATLLQKVMHDEWPELADFAVQTELQTRFWPDQAEIWTGAIEELEQVFQDVALVPFLRRLPLDAQPVRFCLLPNLVYPALTPLPAAVGTESVGVDWFLLLPPPKAVGTSPPWGYAEDPGWVVSVVCAAFAHRLLGAQRPALAEKTVIHLTHALTALCLEQELDRFEGQAHLLRVQKAAGLPDLPQVTARLRRFLAAPEGNLADIVDGLW